MSVTGESALSGTPETLMAQLKQAAGEKLGEGKELPGSFDEAVTVDKAKDSLGLTEEQFTQYVTAAFEAKAMITIQAQTTVLV
ncbi:MAG: hypothetical protein LBJ11_10290 [Oscillospiraceae bacterium]|nr:hypothetical protein [Oscillospiraceae bacterium]